MVYQKIAYFLYDRITTIGDTREWRIGIRTLECRFVFQGTLQGHDHHGWWKCSLRQDAGAAPGPLCENFLFSQSPEIQTYTPKHCYVIPSLGGERAKARADRISAR
jgi:hypothetical protein